MKIACIIHSLNGGGAERVMAALASKLTERGHQVTLVTLDQAGNDRHTIDDRVRRRPLGLMRDSRGFVESVCQTSRRLRAIRHTMIDERPDVVLSFCDRTNVSVLLAMIGTSIDVVASERSDPAQQKLGRTWEFLRCRAYPRAARSVALTDTSARHLQPFSKRPVIVIPSGVDVPPLVSDRVTAAASHRVVAVGRLEYEKGFDRLIRAFAIFHNSNPNWSLRILGEGSQRRTLQRLTSELGVAASVTMPGWVRPIWPELAAANCFVLPSRYEGFPSALLEAMACGLPSIAVDCESGPRAIVHDQVDGLLVESTVTGIVNGLVRFAENPGERESLAANATQIHERFGYDAMVDAYERTLTEVVAGNERRR